MLLWAQGVFAASPAELTAALDTCHGAYEPLPALTAKQTDDLIRGEVVRTLTRDPDPEQPSTAVGVAILRADLRSLWVAIQDPHAQVDPDLLEFVVDQIGPDHALWYGHLDLPRPLANRQWIVRSSNHHALAASGCWEHNWKLEAGALDRVRPFVDRGDANGLTHDQVDAAIFTPVNHGNWLLAPIGPGEVLVAYQATSVVGGSIPDWLVVQLTMSRLESVLRDAELRATTWAPTHYRADHAHLIGGDGADLPLFP